MKKIKNSEPDFKKEKKSAKEIREAIIDYLFILFLSVMLGYLLMQLR